ncbi:MAG: hypothetical protein ACE5KS_07145 [Woeseiaceae bacterium]
MLQESIAFDAPRAGRETSRSAPGSATGIALSLAARLRGMGLRPTLLRSRSGITAGGADLQVWPRKLEQSETAAEHFLHRVAALIDDGVPVTLSLRELGAGDGGIKALEEFCSGVRSALDADLVSRIGLSLHSHQIPLQAYYLISRTLLGGGPRYVILDSLQMQHHDQPRVQEETDSNWSFLWRQRNAETPLIPAYGAGVTTGCPLLGEEAAQAMLPLYGIQVPMNSAWLPIGLHLPRFADGEGRIDWARLQAALEGSIDLGDQLLDILSWPTAGLREDAWLNRRLAILITGIGDLVQSKAADPASLECLKWLDEAVQRVRKILWDRSHVIAGQTGLLPALARSDPSGGLCDHSHRQNWQRRWRLALANSAVRHRNLLVMSPYSVLPDGADVRASYADLLPVLIHADAYAFAGQPPLDAWNVKDFRRFHTRAWAVMQRRSGHSLIAAGV